MMAGNSRTQGGHQLAQKLTTTTLPLLASTSARICFAVTVGICFAVTLGLCFAVAVGLSFAVAVRICFTSAAALAGCAWERPACFSFVVAFVSILKVACSTLSKSLGR